jgi:4-hydroxybenzoate polyprenyltransferase
MTALVAPIRAWAEMVKLSHSIFALPFALMATFLAGREMVGRGLPYPGQLGLVLLCMLAARSVAMTFNRIADADIDARNPRTADRHLPTGRISRSAAWLMLALSAATFGIGCLGFHVLYANTWPILLSGPVLLYLCGYSLTKRFTKWSHYYLGSALALSPVAAWLAIHPASLGWSAVILAITVTCWVAGFDIIYACQDIDVDRREGLHSLPSRLGPGPALWLARISHGLSIIGLVLLGLTARLGAIYAAGAFAAGALLVAQGVLVRPGRYNQIGVAFLPLNGLVSVVVGAAAIVDLLTRPAPF